MKAYAESKLEAVKAKYDMAAGKLVPFETAKDMAMKGLDVGQKAMKGLDFAQKAIDYIQIWCSVVQCVAAWCSALQCVARMPKIWL